MIDAAIVSSARRMYHGCVELNGVHAMSKVLEFNNKCKRLIESGDLAGAEAALDAAALLLRTPEPGRSEMDLLIDELFYCAHRVQLGWRRRSYEEHLEYAVRALALEDRIYASVQTLPTRDLFAFSIGGWSIVSILTRCRQFEGAERAATALLADADRFAARMRHDSDAAERLLLAIQFIYFEARQALPYARGRPLFARMRELVPEPASRDLRYGHACICALLGDRDEALVWLKRAIDAGVSRWRAYTDDDLQSLRDHPIFIQLATPAWWTFKTDPPGASIVIDGVDSGQRTPARVPAGATGAHEFRLTLAGFRDAVMQYVQSRRDGDWGWSTDLESLAKIEAQAAKEARVLADSRRIPDLDERARTLAFLGGPEGWRGAKIRLQRSTTYGRGGVHIIVDGAGEVELRHTPWGQRDELRLALRLGEAELQPLFAAFVAEAFTEMFVGNRPGRPDEPSLSLTLVASDGREHRLGKFASHEHRRFSALSERVHAAVCAQLDMETRKRMAL